MFWLCSFYDYQAITYELIASYVISASMMAYFAKREFDRIKGAISDDATAVRLEHAPHPDMNSPLTQ